MQLCLGGAFCFLVPTSVRTSSRQGKRWDTEEGVTAHHAYVMSNLTLKGSSCVNRVSNDAVSNVAYLTKPDYGVDVITYVCIGF